MTTPESPEALFAAVLAERPSRPLLTFYDDATGERVELSATSLANWVAKTCFLLTDELGLGVGDRAVVALDAHWLAVPILLGCWSAGLAVSTDEPAAAVAFVSPATLEGAAGAPDCYAIAPESAARGFGGAPPAGTSDYVLAVRPQPDSWASVRFAGNPSDPAIGALTRREVADTARRRAGELGLGPGERVLATRAWTTPRDWVDTLLAPLAVGGSIVLVAHAQDANRERRMAQERATVAIY